MHRQPRHPRIGRSATIAVALSFVAVLLTACVSPFQPAADIFAPTATAYVPVTPILTPLPPAPTPTAAPSPTATPTPAPEILYSPEMERAEALLQYENGVYGFVVLAEDGTIVASWNGTTPFITASLYKLIVMADIFRRIELGEFSLGDYILVESGAFDEAGDMYFSWDDADNAFPLSEILYAVGAYSSNVAARTLLAMTDVKALRSTAVAIGMEQTYFFIDPTTLPNWPPEPSRNAPAIDAEISREYLEQSWADGPVNLTTPLDMARYNLALINGTLISPWVSEQIIAILEDQLIRDRIPFFFTDETRVINKPGNLSDAVHDVGIIYLPDGPRALAMLSQAVPDGERATLILQRLALIATGADDIPPLPDWIG